MLAFNIVNPYYPESQPFRVQNECGKQVYTKVVVRWESNFVSKHANQADLLRILEFIDLKKQTYLIQSQDPETNSFTLNECFQLWKTEATNRYKCNNCNILINNNLKRAITNPNVLIVHLQRYAYKKKVAKIKTPVTFPICDMDLSLYSTSNTSNVYDLFAVCSHSCESLNNGHYKGS